METITWTEDVHNTRSGGPGYNTRKLGERTVTARRHTPDGTDAIHRPVLRLEVVACEGLSPHPPGRWLRRYPKEVGYRIEKRSVGA